MVVTEYHPRKKLFCLQVNISQSWTFAFACRQYAFDQAAETHKLPLLDVLTDNWYTRLIQAGEKEETIKRR